MKDLKVRRLALMLVPLAAVFALVLGLSSLNLNTASAQGYGPAASPMAGPAVASTGGSCALYDSWCAYCANSAAAQCEAFVPAHTIGETTAGAQGNSGNEPVMGVTAGCACDATVIGAFDPYSSAAVTTSAYPMAGAYGFNPTPYATGADVGGSWTWCATANMNAGAWVPSGLVGASIC